MPGKGDPSELSEEEREITALRAELDDSLEVGRVPVGWKYEIKWSEERADMHPAVQLVFIWGSAVACWLVWGWMAGAAAIFAAVGLRIILAVGGGPRPGQTIVESFFPPSETVLKVGVAGHTLGEHNRIRPSFSGPRAARPADRRRVRGLSATLGAALLVAGTLTLLEQSRVISPVTYVRAASVFGAAAFAWLAVWIWRSIGQGTPLRDPAPSAHELSPVLQLEHGLDNGWRSAAWTASLSGGRSRSRLEPPKPAGVPTVEEVLDTATAGSTTDVLIAALASTVPEKLNRVLLPTMALGVGVLGVLVAFDLIPNPTQLLSGLATVTEFTVVVLFGARVVVHGVTGLLEPDWTAFRKALRQAALLAVLLLVANLFGWLDAWAAVIAWVRDHVG